MKGKNKTKMSKAETRFSDCALTVHTVCFKNGVFSLVKLKSSLPKPYLIRSEPPADVILLFLVSD